MKKYCLKHWARPFSLPSAGYSMVGVMVAITLLALGVVGTLQTMQLISKRRAAVEWVGERSSLKKLLLNGASCSNLQRCKTDELVEIRSAEARVLVKKNRSSRYGPFLVSARCQVDKTIEFRVAAFKDGVFAKDPLTGKVLNWESPEGVLIRGGDLCGVPQFGSSEEKAQAPRIYMGKLCTADRGTCPAPEGAAADEGAGSPRTMCCADGRDGKKPSCPSGTYELGSYWDRDGDWGLNGRWAVTCQ